MMPLVLLWSVIAVPAPQPTGAHPRLMATAAEIAQAKQRAAGEPLVKQAVDGLVRQAEAVYRQGFEGLPAFDDTANSALISKMVELGYGALLTGRRDWARRVADVLLAYAAEYPTRPQPYEGRIYRYSLQEAGWLTLAAEATDLAMGSGVLSEIEARQIADGLLRPCAQETMTDRRDTPEHRDGHHKCYNFQAWHCAAVGLVGYLLDDPDLIHWAVDARYGFKHLVSHDIRDDGLFWERSPGYSAYVVSATTKLCEAAWRNGTDLWNLQVPDNLVEDEWGSGNFMVDGDRGPKSVTMMLEGAYDAMFPFSYAAAISDSSPFPLSGLISTLEVAVNRTGSDKLAAILNEAYAHNEPAPMGWRTWAPNGSPVIQSRSQDGRCVLALEGHGEADRGCWVSPVAPAGGRDTVQVSLRYRTQGTGEFAKLRIHSYAGAKADPERFDLVTLPTSEDWTNFEHDFKLAPGDDGVGLEIFVWHAAGRLEFNAAEAKGLDGVVLLDPEDFTMLTKRRPSSVRPWNLLPKLPVVERPGPDGTFATAGVRRAGCSLFDATGMAVLRDQWDDPQALAALLSWGPYGGGHGHPGMLELVVGGHGQWLLPALGTVSYDSPLHASWTNTTVGHSTVVIDQMSQFPGAAGAWGNVTPDHKVIGELLDFQATPEVKLVRARCDNAYPGVTLDRTVAIVGGVVVDRFAITPADGQEHTFDYVLHLPAKAGTDALELSPRAPLGDSNGYELLADLEGATEGRGYIVWCGDVLELRLAADRADEFIRGTSPRSSTDDRGPFLMLRKRGRKAVFASVISPGQRSRAGSITVGDSELTLPIDGRELRLQFGARAVDVRWP